MWGNAHSRYWLIVSAGTHVPAHGSQYITSLLIELFLYMGFVYLMLNRLVSFDRFAWPCRASKWCVICALIHQWHRLQFRLLFLDTLVLHFCIWAGVMVFWWFFFQFRWLYRIPISPASPLLSSGPLWHLNGGILIQFRPIRQCACVHVTSAWVNTQQEEDRFKNILGSEGANTPDLIKNGWVG